MKCIKVTMIVCSRVWLWITSLYTTCYHVHLSSICIVQRTCAHACSKCICPNSCAFAWSTQCVVYIRWVGPVLHGSAVMGCGSCVISVYLSLTLENSSSAVQVSFVRHIHPRANSNRGTSKLKQGFYVHSYSILFPSHKHKYLNIRKPIGTWISTMNPHHPPCTHTHWVLVGQVTIQGPASDNVSNFTVK